jgi:hypothetical protein
LPESHVELRQDGMAEGFRRHACSIRYKKDTTPGSGSERGIEIRHDSDHEKEEKDVAQSLKQAVNCRIAPNSMSSTQIHLCNEFALAHG